MLLQPVAAYRAPAYPTRPEVLARPELLAEHQPAAWRARPEVKGAVALFLAANLTACNPAGPSDQARAGGAAAVTLVAPIFAHGEGRGVYGCVAVNPPVFLSEQEALEVIREELRGRGVALTEGGVEFAEIRTVEERYRWVQEPGREGRAVRERVPGTEKPLRLDAADPQKKVTVEFLSRADYFQKGGVRSGWSVDRFDTREVATQLAGRLQREGRQAVRVGVFYDPVTPRRIDPQQWQEAAKAQDRKKLQALGEQGERLGRTESLRLLRAQVKDFADWLKAQGAI